MRDRDEDIDDILKQAAAAIEGPEPSVVDRISLSIGTNLQPVKEPPPFWMLTAGLALSCVTIALAGGSLLGLHGFHKMTAPECGLILSVLGALMLISAALCVAEAIPGSRRPISPWQLGIAGCLVLAVVLGALFHDYTTEQFVLQGVKCLAAGLVNAVPAALAVWWLLRRGFVADVAAAGFARGTLAGLTGTAMLELHCPNFEVPHLLVWHIAVVAVSAAVGVAVQQRKLI